eukprot:CAMPEP_0119524222 /NCGR_PEP_ID=MMETSP1344-20130328/39192_1 /TAXON_ID=236787 /ORGANISM="Florenciella parvula, Strain CCMP2471" /LENGTH=318 /DNA_ID=CAMNT_0007562679 /DNA_START=193 /DNA_END=1146 /DNA_ORIENTATION=-
MFDGSKFSGTIKAYHDGLYHVVYEDGDAEDLDQEELDEVLVATKSAEKSATKSAKARKTMASSSKEVSSSAGKRKDAEQVVADETGTLLGGGLGGPGGPVGPGGPPQKLSYNQWQHSCGKGLSDAQRSQGWAQYKSYQAQSLSLFKTHFPEQYKIHFPEPAQARPTIDYNQWMQTAGKGLSQKQRSRAWAAFKRDHTTMASQPDTQSHSQFGGEGTAVRQRSSSDAGSDVALMLLHLGHAASVVEEAGHSAMEEEEEDLEEEEGTSDAHELGGGDKSMTNGHDSKRAKLPDSETDGCSSSSSSSASSASVSASASAST